MGTGGVSRGGGATAAMRPNVASTIGRTRAGSTAPTTTSTMFLGTKCF